MLWTVCSVVIALASMAMPAWLLLKKRLTLAVDFFFLVLYAEILVYLHIAPTLWMASLAEDAQWNYSVLQAAALVLFELPMLWLYFRFSKRRLKSRAITNSLLVDERKQLLLAIATLSLCIAFLFVALRHDIFYIRLGYEGTIDALLGLSLPEYVAYRLFGLAGAFLVCMLVISLLIRGRSPESSTARQGQVTVRRLTVAVGVVFLLYQGFNSRLHTAVAVLVVLGAIISLGNISLISRKGLLLSAVTGLLFWYGYHFALNVRYMYVNGTLGIGAANPFVSWEAPSDVDDWRFRLNGIDLMARITPAAEREGFAEGAAWKGIALVLVGQMSLGTVVSSADVAAYKADFLGSPKKYLMDRYLGEDWVDIPSCLLTDIYGNFGLYGFPVAAILVACMCAFVRRALSVASSPLAVILSAYLAFHLLMFEQELATLLSGLITTLPALFAVLLVNPLKNGQRARLPTASPKGDAMIRSQKRIVTVES